MAVFGAAAGTFAVKGRMNARPVPTANSFSARAQ
jgi:hypothetical protein